MPDLIIFLLQVAAYAAPPFIFSRWEYTSRRVAMFAYVGILLTLSGFLGASYSLQVTDQLAIPVVNVTYGAFMMNAVLAVIVARDLRVIHTMIKLVMGVGALVVVFFLTAYAALHDANVLPTGIASATAYRDSALFFVVGASLSILELALLLLIFEQIKRRFTRSVAFAGGFIASFIFILCLDGLLFSGAVNALKTGNLQANTGEVPAKFVIGLAYAVPMFAFLLINRDVLAEFTQQRLSVRDLLSAPREILLGEIQRQQKSLQRNETLFRALFEQAGDYCMILDPNTADGVPIIVDANESALQMHGFSRDELIGRPVVILDDQAGRDMVLESTRRIMTGKPFHAERVHVRGDGSTFPVAVHANRIDIAGEPPLIFTSEYDISDRKGAERALQQSETLFRGIYEQSPLAIQLYDRAGLLTDVNPQTLRLFGLDDITPILGFNLWSDPHLTPALADRLRSGKAISVAATLDFDAVRKANLFPTAKTGRCYLDLHAIPLRDGELTVGYLAQLVDITERKSIEAQLQQSQKMEAIGTLAGGIAHDFNNILVPIFGYAEMSLRRVPTTDKVHGNLKRIQTAAKRAQGLVRQILAFSRRQSLEIKVVDLNVIVREFQQMIQRMIDESIELRLNLEPELDPVKADTGQIEQVLMNLVINARDAMPRGGRLTLETANIRIEEDTSPHDKGPLEPGPHVQITVTDTGAGMTEQVLNQVFEPFFTTKEVGQGTGLGLSTAFGIVKQHEGHIFAQSTVGDGTRFTIILPRSAAKPAAEIPNDEHAITAPLQQATVLLVEDEELVRELVRETLTELGCNLMTAATPRAARHLAENHHETLHLLLTDVIMPEMNGRDLYHQISQLHPEVKVLYMSGYTDNVITQSSGFEPGRNFLQKPFAISDLIDRVNTILQTPSPANGADTEGKP